MGSDWCQGPCIDRAYLTNTKGVRDIDKNIKYHHKSNLADIHIILFCRSYLFVQDDSCEPHDCLNSLSDCVKSLNVGTLFYED